MSLDTNALMRAARCFDCLPPSTQEEVQTYLIAYAAGLGSDPDNLARLAKCMKCLSPSTLREVRAYLLAVISGGSTDANTLAQEAKCYTCIPDGMLGAVETYLWSTDPAGPGITDPNALAFAARFFQKLNSPTLLEIQVYALAISAGTGTDPNTLASLAKCFKCLPLPFLRNVGEFLVAAVEPGGGGGGEGISGCTDVPAQLVPVITANYTAGAVTSLNITFPKVCCNPLGWIAVQGDLADLSDGTSIGGGLDTVGHGGESNFAITANITGGFFTPITKTYVGVIQQCQGGVNSAVSNAVNALDLSQNFISFWNFDDVAIGSAYVTAADAKNGNNLTSELAAHPLAVAGLIGEAPEFVSVNNDRLSHASNANFDVAAGESISFSIWFKLTNPSTNSGVISKWNAGDYSYLLWIDPANNLLWNVKNAAGVAQSMTVALQPAIGLTWHHVVVGYENATNQIFKYFDNGARTNAACVGVKSTVYKFAVGNYNDTQPMSGMVDLAGLWKRVLSAGEVSFLFNGGAGRSYPF